jgi:TPR repeat protein
MMSQHHFIGGCKTYAEKLFKEGCRLRCQRRYSDAVKSFGKAAVLQHPKSHAFLSDLILELKNEGSLPDFVNRELSFKLAEAGMNLVCSDCEGVFGHCIIFGIGTPSITKTGLMHIKHSAEKGSCFGQYFLGRLYRDSIDGKYDLEQDYEKAEILFRLAANQGYAIAQCEMGRVFDNSLGICGRQDLKLKQEEAEILFRSLAAEGHYAHEMCENRLGVTKNKKKAYKWYRKAAAQGNIYALFKEDWFML